MDKGQGVLIINYVDDKIAEDTLTGVSNNIFFNVYEASFLGDAKMVSITQTFGDDDDLHSTVTYIPLNNIGLIKYFDNKEGFYKAYPVVKKFEEGE